MSVEHIVTVIREFQAAMSSAGSDPAFICDVAVDHAIRALKQGEGATLELVEGEALVYHAAKGVASTKVGQRSDLHSSLSGLCARTGKSQLCHDCQNDDRVDLAACLRLGVRSAIAVPLPISGNIIGVLKILSPRVGDFSDGDVALAELLVAPLAYGLAAAKAERNERMFVATFEQAAVGICHVAIDGRLIRVNRRFCEISGHSEAALLSGTFQQITHPDDLEADLNALDALIKGDITSYSLEKRYLPHTGAPIWVNLTVSLVRHIDGSPDFCVAVVEDIRKRREAEELAMYDPLTGLANRRHLLKQLDSLLLQRDLLKKSACVVFLDLDRFKTVNDMYGHGEGDRCLCTIAEILRNGVRNSDFVSRLSGDEFVVLMEGCSEVAAHAILERIATEVQTIAAHNGWSIGISAGAVMLPENGVIDSAAVLAEADKQMYDVKKTLYDRRIWHGQ